ncbi:MAG: 3-phosphoglycerate dehydrogenase [Spirochaetes bacterium GWB1_36_13]|nr:MAG: 3-phosphoglycerate dehydrogenase [Spirochaetes bacterium GWB1_36_13]
MYKIQLLNKISHLGLNLLPKDKYENSEKMDNPDGILVRSADMHTMELPANLKAVARAGAGVNNIPIQKCSEKGIVVFNTPGANANGVKELVILGLLMSSRKILPGIEWTKSLLGKGAEVPALVEKGKGDFVGPEIKGKKLGLIGLGAIGVLVANAAQSLGMEVTGFDPYISVEAAWGLSSNVKRATSLDAVYADSDYISLHLPYNDNTKKMINASVFAKMKKGVRILNFARAELVNDTDMAAALESGSVSCYVTDFPNEETLKMKNVVPVPHLGASTPESEDNCAVMAAEEIRDFLENGNIVNSVNFPNCDLGKCAAKKRITLLHQNVPNMVGQITAILANEKINIADMLNKSKGNLAYTMIDLDNEVSESALKSLNAIEGMIKTRVL